MCYNIEDRVMAANTTQKERELFSKLQALGNPKIIAWLDTIKTPQGIDAESRVKNPTTQSKISTIKGDIYPAIIKWCLKNIDNYEFRGIPNIKAIARAINIVIASSPPKGDPGSPAAKGGPGSPAAKGGPGSPSPDITTILEEWKKNPGINPYTKTQMPILVNPNSEYAKLYKKCIKELVDDVLAKKQGSTSPNKDRLSVNDCRYIKECMPTKHAKADMKGGWRARQTVGTIYYDHLFIKYFVSLQEKSPGAQTYSNVYNYDVNYTKGITTDIDVCLYLIVYEIFEKNFKEDPRPTAAKYNTYDTVEKILQSPYIIVTDSKYKIGSIVKTLCKDIKNVLYMHESKITVENINKANYNKGVLKYMASLIRLQSNNNEIRNELIGHYNQTYINDLGVFVPAVFNSSADRKADDNNIPFIYTQIINHIKAPQYRQSNEDILDNLLAIYDSIIKLYSDNNMKNNVYKKVDDEYQTPTVVEPPFPIQEQLSPSSQRDRMRFKLMPNSVDDPEKRKRLQEDADRWKEKMDKYGKEKAKAKIELNQKKFDRNRINDIKNGKVSSHPRRKKWDSEKLHISKRPYNSASPPRVTIIKLINKLKAKSATANHISSSSGSGIVKPDGYYRNDADPYTQENFEDMLLYKRKHTSDIVHMVNGKEFHYRYDTVSLYNYIIDCVRDCVQPVNIAVGRDALLTPENLDEVCRKIKKFTTQPTYASSNEIIAALANCKYDNCLELTAIPNVDRNIIHEMNRTGDYKIVGKYTIYLNLKLGGILFKVINKIDDDLSLYDDFPNQTNPKNAIIMTLPILHNDAADISRFDPDYTDGDVMLMYMKDRLAKGELLGDKYFPNRKNNDVGRRWKKVVDIPDFDEEFGFDYEEDFETTNMKLKGYKAKLALL